MDALTLFIIIIGVIITLGLSVCLYKFGRHSKFDEEESQQNED